MSRYICILGKHPEISIAELKARYPDAEFEAAGDDFAIMLADAVINQPAFNRLGGSIKAAEVIGAADRDNLINKLAEILGGCYKGKKLDYGLSIYGAPEKMLRPLLLGIKKKLGGDGVKARFVNRAFTNISSAQYKSLKSKGPELIIAKTGKKFTIGKTAAVQDIDSYSKRDYGKPFRDMQMGMLPPKLAQIMINLAGSKGRIWDPFCGSGTILMEGLLTGRDVLGSDIDTSRAEGAKKNMAWLKREFGVSADAKIFVHDATMPTDEKFDAIVFEGDLGAPHNQYISPDRLNGIIRKLDDLYVRFFENLKRMNCRAPIVCALPFFRLRNGKEIEMNETIEKIRKMGFQLISAPLKYSRRDQSVGRAVYRFMLRTG